VGRLHGGLPQGDQRGSDTRGNRQVPEPKTARTASWHTVTAPDAAVCMVVPTTLLTTLGSTGPTTKIVHTASTARNEQSRPEKCPKTTGRADNKATTKFEATPDPGSNAGLQGTEKGRRTHHLPTGPPGKTGTRPKVTGGNQHACPRGQGTGGSNAYWTSRDYGITGYRYFNTGRYGDIILFLLEAFHRGQ
jgi:hypothetical protein